MPTGPLTPDPDHDEPERTPTVVRVWGDGPKSGSGVYSFCPADLSFSRRVQVPFPLAPAFDDREGIVLKGLWTKGPVHTAAKVIEMAHREENGFRFVEEEQA